MCVLRYRSRKLGIWSVKRYVVSLCHRVVVSSCRRHCVRIRVMNDKKMRPPWKKYILLFLRGRNLIKKEFLKLHDGLLRADQTCTKKRGPFGRPASAS